MEEQNMIERTKLEAEIVSNLRFTRIAANVVDADKPQFDPVHLWVRQEAIACKKELREQPPEQSTNLDCALRGYSLASTYKLDFVSDLLREYLVSAAINTETDIRTFADNEEE